jgi:CubicO group peptidase (beta-lactamase class C family)
MGRTGPGVLDRTEQQMTTTARPVIDQAHWQQRLDELALAHRVPGASLAVLRLGGDGGGEDELVEAATGVLNTATGVAVTTDSVFQIGSISKVWTATLVMQLVDEGKLQLDAPVAEVLPDLQLADADVAGKVTMRHLLTHTSGIDGDIFTDTGRGDDVLERYVASLADAPQNHPLGATFSYCNSGFSLAGRVVEVVTGQTWDAVLRERIIGPLGLTSTSTLPEEAILHRVAVGHIAPGPEQELQPTTTWMLPRSLGPAGLINATARDVTGFARMHLRDGLGPDGGVLLSAGATAQMQELQTELPDTYSLGDSWGLGWIRFDWHGERLYGHDGTTIGQNAFLRVLPSQGIAVALLTNGGHPRDLFSDLYGEVFAELAGVQISDQLAPPATAPDVELSRYVGTYERSSITTEVFERDGGLVLRVIPTGTIAESTGATVEEMELHPVEQGLFVTRAPGEETWMAAVFYTLPDGAEYLHYGVRAQPRKA